jgi:hypothetical protein
MYTKPCKHLRFMGNNFYQSPKKSSTSYVSGYACDCKQSCLGSPNSRFPITLVLAFRTVLGTRIVSRPRPSRRRDRNLGETRDDEDGREKREIHNPGSESTSGIRL